MYESSNVAETIKKTALSRNIQIKTVLSALDLNKNTLSNMYKGSMLRSDNLARIADYLDCSVDYLLGRTDNPLSTTDATDDICGNLVSSDPVVEDLASSPGTIIIPNGGKRKLSEECAALIHIYESLDVRRRIQLLKAAFEMADTSSEPEKAE